MHARRDRSHIHAQVVALALAAILAIGGCAKPIQVKPPPKIFASAEQVEENFRGRTFIFGDNNQIAE
ncbi:MAG: hypothetical protein JWM69_790, partial [Candidatus Binatus sp.]|nr:hypothetical protein [Candidatus Binatus sp.]